MSRQRAIRRRQVVAPEFSTLDLARMAAIANELHMGPDDVLALIKACEGELYPPGSLALAEQFFATEGRLHFDAP